MKMNKQNIREIFVTEKITVSILFTNFYIESKQTINILCK